MLAVGGSTEMLTSVAAVTVKDALPEIAPEVAVIVADPTLLAVASPAVPVALETVATVESVELQVTVPVRFCVVVSEYTPVAVNCCVVPLAMLGFGGVTWMLTSVAAVMVSVAVPATPPKLAVMVLEPTPIPVARPLDEIEAVPVLEEVQATIEVKSWVVLSVNVPVAVNCWVVPFGMLGVAGVTWMLVSVAAVTVNFAVPETAP
jgi:hypothetical protein